MAEGKTRDTNSSPVLEELKTHKGLIDLASPYSSGSEGVTYAAKEEEDTIRIRNGEEPQMLERPHWVRFDQ